FMDEPSAIDTNETSVESEPVVETKPISQEIISEPTTEPQPEEIIPEPVAEPIVEIPESTTDIEPENVDTTTTETIDKPEYDVGSKDDSVFVDETGNADSDVFYDEAETDESVSDLSDSEEYYEE
ncbi:MAG: hypothetical protein MJ158_04490, partial [Alphaproteobacteria bacterium]|nr:hypothetical protein [Alphaproteobacteria bacterium]